MANLAVNAANKVVFAAAGALERVLLAMDAHAGDEHVQQSACHALKQLALNAENQAHLAAAGAPARIIRAMARFDNVAGVQRFGCGALRFLAADSAENQDMLAGAGAIARILRAMTRHEDFVLQRAACHALWCLAASDDNKLLLAREGAHELLLAALARFPRLDLAQGEEEEAWEVEDLEQGQDDPQLGARRALLRLAETEDARVGDPWPVVIDRLRLIRLSLTVEAWADGATTRLAALFAACPLPFLVERVAMLTFGSELVPAEGWASAGGRELAQLRLFPRAHARLAGNILTFERELLATQAAQMRDLAVGLASMSIAPLPVALAVASAAESGTTTSAASSSDSSADATEQGKTRRCASSGCPNCATHICGSCESVSYCSQACQKLHWPAHKAACMKLASIKYRVPMD
jgi:hypothetical protein